MKKIQIIRRFQFCAGHRVFKHESKCRHPHGHNYLLYATFEKIEDELDNLGRVIDFSVIKQVLGDWIDLNLDHGFIYFKLDEDMKVAMAPYKNYELSCNPTAENIASHILKDICPVLFQGLGVQCVKIVLFETENCSTEVAL